MTLESSKDSEAFPRAPATTPGLATAVWALGEGFAQFDVHCRLVRCNEAYARFFRTSVAALVGCTFEGIVNASLTVLEFADDSQRSRFVIDRLDGCTQLAASFDVRARDGRSFRMNDRSLEEGGFIETIWDVTGYTSTLQRLNEDLASANAASTAKSEFLSSMSHELRTPLNAILGFAQLLQRDKKEPLSARHKERVSQILAGGEHLLRLVNDILDLSRIEAGGVSMSPEPVTVRDVLEEVMTTLEPAAARADVRIDLAALPLEVPPIMADRTRFAQILMRGRALRRGQPHEREGARRPLQYFSGD
jgi:signal transduction histidine kinase